MLFLTVLSVTLLTVLYPLLGSRLTLSQFPRPTLLLISPKIYALSITPFVQGLRVLRGTVDPKRT